MSDVRFRNLDNVPLQEEFNPSTVFKISTASKIVAAVIGIISICVFTLTDNAKTPITTISSKNVDGQCTMLSSFTGTLPRTGTTVSANIAKSFVDGFFTLLQDLTGTTKNTYLSDWGLQQRSERVSDFLTRKSDSVTFFQVYFPTYQSCIDEFSKTPVCSYVQLLDYEGDDANYDRPYIQFLQNGNFPLKNVCRSTLKCTWPDVLRTDSWEYWRVYINVTNFKCAPLANFTTCESISSKCPEYARFAASFGDLFHRIHPAEQMCQTFKSNPPYTCQSFQVASPIQVISQTLSLMATALGGTELFLYVLLKYRHMWPSSSNAQVQPESTTMPSYSSSNAQVKPESSAMP
jgi:hypothetical protein